MILITSRYGEGFRRFHVKNHKPSYSFTGRQHFLLPKKRLSLVIIINITDSIIYTHCS